VPHRLTIHHHESTISKSTQTEHVYTHTMSWGSRYLCAGYRLAVVFHLNVTYGRRERRTKNSRTIEFKEPSRFVPWNETLSARRSKEGCSVKGSPSCEVWYSSGRLEPVHYILICMCIIAEKQFTCSHGAKHSRGQILVGRSPGNSFGAGLF